MLVGNMTTIPPSYEHVREDIGKGKEPRERGC